VISEGSYDTLDIAGKPQRLADYCGDVVVVNIWATWCGVCRDEMPKLENGEGKVSEEWVVDARI